MRMGHESALHRLRHHRACRQSTARASGCMHPGPGTPGLRRTLPWSPCEICSLLHGSPEAATAQPKARLMPTLGLATITAIRHAQSLAGACSFRSWPATLAAPRPGVEATRSFAQRGPACPGRWSQHDRVSGRSPELTAKGAQRPSGRNTGLGRQAHIWHPVLVGVGISGNALEAIWQRFEKALAALWQGVESELAGNWQAIGSQSDARL